MCVYYSTEEFGTDERIVIISAKEGRGLELIEELRLVSMLKEF